MVKEAGERFSLLSNKRRWRQKIDFFVTVCASCPFLCEKNTVLVCFPPDLTQRHRNFGHFSCLLSIYSWRHYVNFHYGLILQLRSMQDLQPTWTNLAWSHNCLNTKQQQKSHRSLQGRGLLRCFPHLYCEHNLSHKNFISLTPTLQIRALVGFCSFHI